MSRLKGRYVYSPYDEVGAILLNRVGGRISAKKKGERGVMYELHNTWCRGKTRSKGLGEETTVEEGINPSLKETYIGLSRAAPPRDHERPAGVIDVDR